jgi:hypothetical protein
LKMRLNLENMTQRTYKVQSRPIAWKLIN